ACEYKPKRQSLESIRSQVYDHSKGRLVPLFRVVIPERKDLRIYSRKKLLNASSNGGLFFRGLFHLEPTCRRSIPRRLPIAQLGEGFPDLASIDIAMSIVLHILLHEHISVAGLARHQRVAVREPGRN